MHDRELRSERLWRAQMSKCGPAAFLPPGRAEWGYRERPDYVLDVSGDEDRPSTPHPQNNLCVLTQAVRAPCCG